jgi:hypothetical protein
MGFQAVLDDGLYLTYLRIDTDRGVCTITIDVREDEVWEEQLVKYLDYYGLSLADFWNLYDKTSDA